MNKNPDSLKVLNEDDLGKVAGGEMTRTILRCPKCGKRASKFYMDNKGQDPICEDCYEIGLDKI